MKKNFTLFKLLTVCILFSVKVFATDVSGPINGNVTWTKANSPYVITGTVTVGANQTLTIEPGVTVEITTGAIQLDVQGTLNAVGTTVDSINFLIAGSYAGNSQIQPILFETASKNSVVKYANFNGLGFYYNNDGTYGILINSTNCSISNCTIQNTRGTGIGIDENAKPLITNNKFLANSNFDIVNHPDELKNISGNDSLKIGLYQNQVAIASTDTLKATNYYYTLISKITVPLTKTLIINPGAKVEIQTGAIQLIVQGTLKAVGKRGNNIQFLPYGSYAGNSQVVPISFENTSQSSVCQYVTFNGLGYYYNNDYTPAIVIRSSSCKIDSCIIQNTRGVGILIGKGAKPTISNNSFSGNTNLDVILDPDKLRNLTGNNPLNIGLTDSIPMAQNDTLIGTNLLYRLLNTLTIPVSKTLVINPAALVQIPTGSRQLIVEGTLIAKGSADNYAQIVRLDDYVGNSQQTPIMIDAGSQNTLFQYVIIDQFGYYYNDDTKPTVVIKSSSCKFINTILQNSRGLGMEIENASPTFTQSCFYSNINGAVVSTGGNPTFFHCNFTGNTSGIVNTSATDSVYADSCYWGDAAGPLQSVTNPTGVGDSVSVKVVYQPFSPDQFNCSEEILPVSLLNFSATYVSSNLINCKWQTAEEINADYFTVQRSTNGYNFSDVGKVAANGNSKAINTYNYADNTFSGLNASKLYYRLKETDKDGKNQFSVVNAVNIIKNLSVLMYPVPAKDVVHIDLTQVLSDKAVIMLYDMNGKQIKQKKILSNNLHQQLEINNLPQGNYHLLISDNGKNVYSSNVVIMH